MGVVLALVVTSCGEPGATGSRDESPPPARDDGWRLLADELIGDAYRTGIATDYAQYARLWADVGMAAEAPSVDFTDEIVVWFGAVYGSSCPIRLDDVVLGETRVSDDRPLIHSVTLEIGQPTDCTDDANPHAFMVAIERSSLPAGPFALQPAAREPPVGAPEVRTLVDVDLSKPGAVAGPDDVGPDPQLIGTVERRLLRSGAIIEPGEPQRYEIHVHCGIGVLGRVNDTWWQTDEGKGKSDYIPEAWRGLATDGETIEVKIILSEGSSPGITATANDHYVRYRPAGEVPRCL